MLHWMYWLGIVIITIVALFLGVKRWKTSAANEIELFEVMSNDSTNLTPSTTPSEITKNKLMLAKGQKFNISGDFEKTTLHLIPHTAQGVADSAHVETIGPFRLCRFFGPFRLCRFFGPFRFLGR